MVTGARDQSPYDPSPYHEVMTPDDARLDPAELEREYSPSSRVGGTSAPFIDDYVARSTAATHALADRVEVLADGTRIMPGRPDAPVLVFIHGGYWQALSAEHSMYLAPGAHARGWSYVAVDYTIAPDGTVERMVDECRHAVTAAVGALRRDGRTGPVLLAGHSAGAHLAAMVTLVDAPPARRLTDIRRIVLLSGVFDLRPIIHTTVNDPLHLTLDRALALSPVLHPAPADAADRPGADHPDADHPGADHPGAGRDRDTAADVIVAWGDDDTLAFARQSRVYADILRQAGHRVTAVEVAQRHHFDIVDDLVSPTTPLGRLVADGL